MSRGESRSLPPESNSSDREYYSYYFVIKPLHALCRFKTSKAPHFAQGVEPGEGQGTWGTNGHFQPLGPAVHRIHAHRGSETGTILLLVLSLPSLPPSQAL